MRKVILSAVALAVLIFSFEAFCSESVSVGGVLESHMEFQHSPAEPNVLSAVAVHFSLGKSQHFYAEAGTAPSGRNLKIIASAKDIGFSEPIFGPSHEYFDKITNKKLQVYSDDFTVYVPFKAPVVGGEVDVKIEIDALACSEQMCTPVNYELSKQLIVASPGGKAAFDVPAPIAVSIARANIWVAFSLAIVAGLMLNVMPCVWPVLPIIVMRILDQAEKNNSRTIALGLAFCVGILLFFAALAAVNIVLKVSFGVIFQWGDQFRNPDFVAAMGLLMVALAMFMFGVFSFGIPASMASGSKNNGGFAGSVGTGFLAAVLSTPCSFAILTFVLAWAQTQPLLLSTVTIMIIGVGMSLPYLVLTSMPSLLAKVPKPGRWMEMFKQATGFLLLGIGVKLIEAVPGERLISVLYYAVILAICIWIWGSWVSYNTKPVKKWAVRFFAVALAVAAGFYFLTEPKADVIEWQKYDAQKITAARQAGRPVLIKFTADWCLSCKVLDKTVYADRSVADLIEKKNVLAIKGDTTEFDYPASVAMREVYNEPAVPVTILLLPGEDAAIRLRGNLIKGNLKKHLKQLPEK